MFLFSALLLYIASMGGIMIYALKPIVDNKPYGPFHTIRSLGLMVFVSALFLIYLRAYVWP